MMPYLAAVAGFSSTFSFTILTLPFIVPASSSSAGAIILHGPHHSAQKSTTTGSVDLSTCASKSESDTFETPIGHLGCLTFGFWANAPFEDAPERMVAGAERQGAITPRCCYAAESLDNAASSSVAGTSVSAGPSVQMSAARTV